MNRKQRRDKKNRPAITAREIPTSFDKPIHTIAVDPNGPSYHCPGHQGQGCSRDADFVIIAERDGQRYGFPACNDHLMGFAELIDSLSPKHDPRTDIADCAKDMEAGFNALGWDPDMPGVEVLDRGGVHIMPCPVCSDAGIDTHLLKVRKAGELFSVEAVAV
jgi:hypothetical protein